MLICIDWSISCKTFIVNAPKQYQLPSGKEWICIFIQTNMKIKFSQVCVCNKWAGNMLMFQVDIDWLGSRFKNNSF